MRDLAEKHLEVYMNKVLLEALKDFNIEYNIISITRDNASSNDTLITAFIKHYTKEAIKFQGDTPCIAYMLNLVVQDILKSLIKKDYDTSYVNDIYNVENNKEDHEINFSIWKKIRKIIIGLKYGQENKRILQAQIQAHNIEKPRLPQLATTKLQAEKYLTIYYIIPEVFLIYTKLENFRTNFQDKLFVDAINSGIAKLRKYYPRIGVLDNKSKNFYISLILDPRLKEEGLKALGLSIGFISDIKARLKTDFDVYEADYLRDNPIVDNDGDICRPLHRPMSPIYFDLYCTLLDRLDFSHIRSYRLVFLCPYLPSDVVD
ncbi:hypothetical protein DL98DRAFT_577629 [Cadophora sp. DSE1049]|nr:hypothetical protein DL98DRAFT_577629 [Cadophora sp. DSE1049]